MGNECASCNVCKQSEVVGSDYTRERDNNDMPH